MFYDYVLSSLFFASIAGNREKHNHNSKERIGTETANGYNKKKKTETIMMSTVFSKADRTHNQSILLR